MAITAGSTANGDSATNATTLTYALNNVAGDGLLVGVFDQVNSTLNVTGVTYNGIAMTLVNVVQWGTTAVNYLWYLANPATGTNNVVCTRTVGAFDFASLAQSYVGTGGSGMGGNSTNSTASAGSTLVTTASNTNANDWGILFVAGSRDATGGTNAIKRSGGGLPGGMEFFDTNTTVGSTGSYSMTVSTTSGQAFGTNMVFIKPAGGVAVNSGFFFAAAS